MQFSSYHFLFAFLPIVFLLHLLTRGTRWNAVMLTVSGYVFYAWGQPWLVIMLFAASIVDFYVGIAIDKAKSLRGRRLWLLSSIVFNIGMLCVFKYSGWLFTGINDLLAAYEIHQWQLPVLDIALPPGISFYTFQTLSYTIDIYRREIKPHRKLFPYLAFVSFFPHLTAGPIMRARDLLPQIEYPRLWISWRTYEHGFFMLVWGLFKKITIADNMGGLVEVCKGNLSVTGAGLVLALAFTFQIYADFSAYSDCARGCARFFGVKLIRNFWTPYLSRNPSEFWQRWHISLSSWIRDYVYIPLGGSRQGKMRTLFNLLFTMFLAGLWHGAGVFFILWGFYHGLLLAFYRFFPLDRWLERLLGKTGRIISIMLFFCLTAFGWVLFFSKTATEFLHITGIGQVTAQTPPHQAITFSALLYGWFIFAMPVIVTDIIAYRKNREFTDLWPAFGTRTKIFLYLFIFYGIVFFGAREAYTFIYFQF